MVRFHRLRRPINLVLALVLLLASTLGLVHGTLHGPGLQDPTAALGLAATSHGHPGAAGEAGTSGTSGTSSVSDSSALPAVPHAWLYKLFDHHDGGEQCRLYDQLSGTCSPLGVPLAALPALALASASFAFFRGQAPRGPSAPFEARGPPTVR